MKKKKKFEKNIFTEVIEEKNIQDKEQPTPNNNDNKDNNKDNQKEVEANKIISSKSTKIIKKIEKINSQDFISIEDLRNICWNGIPFEQPEIRAECWKILLGLYPLNKKLRQSSIQKKKRGIYGYAERLFKIII